MADTYTSNLGLTKPGYDSPVDIGVINANMDKIDNAVANAGKVKSVNGKTGDVTIDDVPKLNGKSADKYMLKTDTAADSAKLDGKDAVYYLGARNLLDNSDFRNPVNQRGFVSGSTVTAYNHFIDRWKAYEEQAITLSDDGVGLESGKTISQYLEGIKSGIELTFAVCLSDGKKAVATAEVNYNSDGSWLRLVTTGVDNLEIYVDTYAGKMQVIIFAKGAITVKRAALYEGSYTADNLPPYVPKEPPVELSACRRRFRRKVNALLPGFVSASSKGITVFVENDEPFASVPTFTVESIAWIRGAGKNITTIPTWTTSVYSNNAISPVFSIDFAEAIDQTAYASVYVYCSYTLSADL